LTVTNTITGSVSGNAGTVTNGVVTTGAYSDPTWLTLTKTKVGLGNVDNTTDAAKPVSTATQTALDLKAPKASPTFTGTVTLGAVGDVSITGGTTGQILTTNGSGTLSWTTASSPGATAFTGLSDVSSADLTIDDIYLQAITRLNVTANGSTAYRFDQYGTTDDPTIYAISGTTIAFNLQQGSNHPFLIRTSGGVNYNTGLVHVSTAGVVSTGSSAQGQVSGTLYWKIPEDITGNYQYICSIHSGMVGIISITPGNNIGYLNIPQNAQTANYNLVLADSGKHIFHALGASAATYTIPANSSVAYPIGTAITFINMAVANVTIEITTDTMYLSGTGTTGSRTLAQYGSATAIKITSTSWLISGSGLA
jgi:plastocyanin